MTELEEDEATVEHQEEGAANDEGENPKEKMISFLFSALE